MTVETEAPPRETRREKSLYEKYDVPIHHLDFEYVNKCKNVKELEKIVKILRSKEEGHYPELLKATEERLSSLDVNNRLLREDAPLLNKRSFSKDEWDALTLDLQIWKSDVESKESALSGSKRNISLDIFPDVRGPPVMTNKMNTKETVGSSKPQRISSFDYKSWDKFDADEECKKLDLAEEKKEEENKRKAVIESAKSKEKSIEDLAIESLRDVDLELLSDDERNMMAVKEKDVGNEYYNAHRIGLAIRHYTRSIHIWPTCTGFNNRAAAYLKQCRFDNALSDLNKALDIEPNNVKAYFRRAVTYQHKNKFLQALDDINKVILKEPRNIIARHIADQLRENCASLPKKHRLKIKDKESGDTNVNVVTEEEMLRDYKDPNFIEVNDWGLPKFMCNCNGKYSNEPGWRHEHNMRCQYARQNSASQDEATRAVSVNSNYRRRRLSDQGPVSVKPELVELEKIVEDEKDDEMDTSPKSSFARSSTKSCIVIDKRAARKVISKTEKTVSMNLNLNNDVHHRSATVDMNVIEEQPPQMNGCPETNHTPSEIKDVKTSKNITIQEISMNSASNDVGEINNDFNKCVDLRPQECGCLRNYSSYQFKECWNNIETEEGSDVLSRKADLLKTICPNHLPRAIGNSWDNRFLVDLLKCLHDYFDIKTEKQLIGNYLKAITSFDRFTINYMFLNSEEIKMAKELAKACSSCIEPALKQVFA